MHDSLSFDDHVVTPAIAYKESIIISINSLLIKLYNHLKTSSSEY